MKPVTIVVRDERERELREANLIFRATVVLFSVFVSQKGRRTISLFENVNRHLNFNSKPTYLRMSFNLFLIFLRFVDKLGGIFN